MPLQATSTAPASAERAPSKTRRIMMVVGEASGDLHGGDLAREIISRGEPCDIFGIAGEHMRSAGVRALVRMEDIHGLGLSELGATAGRTLRAFLTLRRILRRENPDLLILIDYAEFNLMLSGVAKRAGVPVLYYITPQVWAWRRGRIRKLVHRADKLAVVLPFEADLYQSAGDRVAFVGHPLLDRVNPAQNRADNLKRLGLAPNAKLIAILPGSRRAEVKYMLAPIVEAARVLARDHGLTPVLALAPTLTRDELARASKVDLDGIIIVERDTYSVLAASEVALVTSGTATLEAALLGCPEVIAYKLTPFSYLIGIVLVRGVEFFGLPNILAGRKIVPELLQHEVTVDNLVRAAEPLLSPTIRSATVAELNALREKLGMPGAAARVATMALEMTA